MADKNCMTGMRALDSKLKIEITHKSKQDIVDTWIGCRDLHDHRISQRGI